MMEYKPFNLRSAQDREEICTKLGVPAKFVFFLRDAAPEEQVIAKVAGRVLLFNQKGQCPLNSDCDLVMSPICLVEGRPVYKGDDLWLAKHKWKVQAVARDPDNKNLVTVITSGGRYLYVDPQSLIWERQKFTRFFNLNKDGSSSVGYLTRSEADMEAREDRVDCKEISWFADGKEK